ncbi:MAG TPA: coenzyme F420-0:L-glutamate ligase [Candidatus Binatus sp.]|jgi:coenzyme F420-0:L-glutamate ligase/coenzyme F420-1:gamma-L-glutamate ligase|nr:coenzyme F420-0:L-glutamate ligase [Candidatus Binatus sp.]
MSKLRGRIGSAAKRRKNAAHGASRGAATQDQPAPKGRKNPSHASPTELHLIPISLADEIFPGDSIADKLLDSVRFESGDILVVKHKIVSKAEGRLIDLATVQPSAESVAWAKQYTLDARVIELALRESRAVIRRKNGVLITETHHGFLCANSGVDVSNVDGGDHALLLPEEPDRSAANLRRAIKRRTGLAIPVIITDSFGRPWREGLTEFAIGIAGMKPLRDDRGRRDSHGYRLKASVEAIADELACAAGLVCGKLNRAPACIVRGFRYDPGAGGVKDLLRPASGDLFR